MTQGGDLEKELFPFQGAKEPTKDEAKLDLLCSARAFPCNAVPVVHCQAHPDFPALFAASRHGFPTSEVKLYVTHRFAVSNALTPKIPCTLVQSFH